MTNTYVNRLRTSVALAQPTGSWTNGFTYDNAARLSNVIMSAGTFVYTYPAGLPSRLPIKLRLPNTSYVTNTYDADARMTGTYLKKSDNTVLDSYAYVYDPANERTNVTRADCSTVAYSYDNIGQLKVADSSVPGEDRNYAYDAAWNVTNNGGTLVVNSLNELTSGPYGAMTWDSNGNVAAVPSNQQTNSYDDENRLTRCQFYEGAYPLWRTDFVYDGLGRLRVRTEYEGIQTSQPSWRLWSETHYIYDGWRVIQERDDSNTPQVAYTRGSDLSGTLEGAGGIGGMLARSSDYSGGSGNWSTHNYYLADGNGNITYIVDSSQALAASYRYDPFGAWTGGGGPLANANVYRFSSKEQHAFTGIYYYGYRFYDPNLQRWINRDPIEDKGFVLIESRASKVTTPLSAASKSALYDFVANNPIQNRDAFGLFVWSGHTPEEHTCICDVFCLDENDLPTGDTARFKTVTWDSCCSGNDGCCQAAAVAYCAAPNPVTEAGVGILYSTCMAIVP